MSGREFGGSAARADDRSVLLSAACRESSLLPKLDPAEAFGGVKAAGKNG